MLRTAAKLDNLPMTLTAVRSFLTKYEVLSDLREKITLATEEILVNIIAYAYPETPGDIEIRWHITPESHDVPHPSRLRCVDPDEPLTRSSETHYVQGRKLVIEITDWGIPFDPRHIPEPNIDLPVENLKAGGLGIWIVQNLTEELHYRRENEKNILTLIFDLP
jgi:anti-sigma regulatory factor (Ser/Thr protein kinase)